MLQKEYLFWYLKEYLFWYLKDTRYDKLVLKKEKKLNLVHKCIKCAT